MAEIELTLRLPELTLRFPEKKLGHAIQLLQALQSGQGEDHGGDIEKTIRTHVEGIAKRDLERIRETTSPSFKMESDVLPSFSEDGSTTGDRERYFQLWENLWKSFPNSQYEVERLIVSGNMAVCCWHGSGKQQGPWANVSATGQGLDIHGCSIYEVKDGKISALFNYMDTGRLYGQMGFRPSYVGGSQPAFTPMNQPGGKGGAGGSSGNKP